MSEIKDNEVQKKGFGVGYGFLAKTGFDSLKLSQTYPETHGSSVRPNDVVKRHSSQNVDGWRKQLVVPNIEITGYGDDSPTILEIRQTHYGQKRNWDHQTEKRGTLAVDQMTANIAINESTFMGVGQGKNDPENLSLRMTLTGGDGQSPIDVEFTQNGINFPGKSMDKDIIWGKDSPKVDRKSKTEQLKELGFGDDLLQQLTNGKVDVTSTAKKFLDSQPDKPFSPKDIVLKKNKTQFEVNKPGSVFKKLFGRN